MNQSKTRMKSMLPVLIGIAIAPSALFAQVLGGAVDIGGGIGVQAGPVGVGGNTQVGTGLRTEAVRETARRARKAAARAEAEARAAADATVRTTATVAESAAFHATAHAAAGAATARTATTHGVQGGSGDAQVGGGFGLAGATSPAVTRPVSSDAQAGADTATGAQATGHASEQPSAAISGKAGAAARSGLTTQPTKQASETSSRQDEARSRAVHKRTEGPGRY